MIEEEQDNLLKDILSGKTYTGTNITIPSCNGLKKSSVSIRCPKCKKEIWMWWEDEDTNKIWCNKCKSKALPINEYKE